LSLIARAIDLQKKPPPIKSCPECGFDISPPLPCRTCGYNAQWDLAKPSGSRGNWLPFSYVIALLLAFTALFTAKALSLPVVKAQAVVTSTSAPIQGTPQQADPAQNAKNAAVMEQRQAPKPDVVIVSSAKISHASETDPLPVVASKSDRAVFSSVSSTFDVSQIGHPPLSPENDFVRWMLAHTDQKEGFLRLRWQRAQVILQREEINNQRVIEAFLLTPREYFSRDLKRAYESAALPIGYGQTISGPHLVARMTDCINPQPEQKVLEIGTGSGYQSAVLSLLSDHVYTVEIVSALARETDQIYLSHTDRHPEYGKITRKVDDGYYGWAEYAPFDRIIVTCGIDHVPPELLTQLAPEGIMVIPVGPPSGQTILRIVKHVDTDGNATLEREDIYHGKRKVIFVPFTAGKGSVHTDPGK
jgi:protein-L-isoaspartate(D-aspartate) O-methyltransferase